MPAARYEYDKVGESGAPPETKYRKRPPTPSRHFENTSLLASFCVEAFSLERIKTLMKEEVDERYRLFKLMSHFEVIE